jgi:Skp family chaperone for outer membrane proteins
MKRVFVGIALGAAALAAVTAAPAWSAATEAPKLGVVDMERVAAEYREMQTLNAQFQDFQRDQENELRQSHETLMLSDAERQEYTDKTAMAAPTEATKARLTELVDLSSQREQRLMELRKNAEPNAEEKTEMEDLGKRYEARMAELAQLQADLQASRTAKYGELSQLITDNVNAAIKAVADSKQILMVFRKDSVLVGGIDVTDAVIENLNAPKATAAAPAK